MCWSRRRKNYIFQRTKYTIRALTNNNWMEVKPGQGSDSIHGNCSGNNCSHFFSSSFSFDFSSFVLCCCCCCCCYFFFTSYRIRIRCSECIYILTISYQLIIYCYYYFPSLSCFLFYSVSILSLLLVHILLCL